jgi:hypothetical protein
MTEEDLRLAVKEAMRARDTARTRVLRNVLAAVKNQQIEKRSALTAAEGVAVIQREAKQCRETLGFARDAGRAESVGAPGCDRGDHRRWGRQYRRGHEGTHRPSCRHLRWKDREPPGARGPGGPVRGRPGGPWGLPGGALTA